MQGPSGSGSSGSDSGKQAPPPYPGNQRAPPYPTNQVAPPYPVNQMAPPPYPVNQVSRPYPVNQMAPNHGTPMQPMYPAAQNPGMPMQPVYPSAPNPGTPMYPVNPTAPPLHSPPQQSPQVGMQYVPVRGGCRNCGGFISHEYDSGMLACAIILSIICFPCGLLTFCCIDKEARCRQCGMAAGLAPGYNNRHQTSAKMHPSNPPPPPGLHPQVVIHQVPAPGGCTRCGGLVKQDYDMGCLIFVILISIFCFPCGLLGLCCLEGRPRCANCGMSPGGR